MNQADNAPDKIDEHYRLQLSALLDGALSPDEARFLLRRLQHDEELADCWARWQLCGDILRGQADVELPERLLPGGFATRVARAIAADGDHAAISSSAAKSSGWLRWGGGTALAASAAMVAVLLMRQTPEPAAGAADPVEVATTPAPAAPLQDAAPASAPATVAADTAAVAASVAVAATEVPRRANAGATRTTEPRRIATARAQAPATSIQPSPDSATSTSPDVVAGTAAAPIAVADAAPGSQADALDGFVLRQPPQSRPWPRALIPTSSANGGFTVGHAGATTLPAFPPFQTRTPVIVIDEGEGDGAEQAGADDETGNAPY